MDVDFFRNRVVGWFADIRIDKVVANDECRKRLVSRDVITKRFNIIVGHDHQADAGRHCANDIASRGKVWFIVIHNHIVEYASRLTALNRWARKVEHQNACCVASRIILIHIGKFGVFNFYASNVFIHVVSSYDDIF